MREGSEFVKWVGMEAAVGTNGVIPNVYVSPVRRSVSSRISKVLAIERRKIDQYGILGGSVIEVANQSRQLFASGLQNGTLVSRKSRHICRPPQAIAADAGGSDALPAPKKFMGVETITLKKVIPLGLMFFCILFNYTILRDNKDVLVVTAKGSSAEIIPFLKTWVNFPMAIGFMIIYTKMSNTLSKKDLLYSCIFPFISFFGEFSFMLYPLNNVIHPTTLADSLLQFLGPSFLGPISILQIWSFCLFYVMADIWGSVVVSVLFWGFTNQVCISSNTNSQYSVHFLSPEI